MNGSGESRYPDVPGRIGIAVMEYTTAWTGPGAIVECDVWIDSFAHNLAVEAGFGGGAKSPAPEQKIISFFAFTSQHNGKPAEQGIVGAG